MVARAAGPPIDKALIVTTALRLLDEVGLAGLTLRRLATELGVQAPALYWHVRSKRDLLDAMADEIVATALPDGMREPTPGQEWSDWLIERARAIRRSTLARRDGALVMMGNLPTAAALPGIERMVAALVDAGLAPDEALKAMLAIGTYTMGWVIEEQAYSRRATDESWPAGAAPTAGPGSGPGDGPSVGSVVGSVVERFGDVERFPRFAAATEALGAEFSEAAFEFGLRALVEGFRASVTARLAARPPATR
jgi:TetR/AcrR family tetracycline transcriptional repressor